MLLSILDEKTFMVGGKTYKVGEELDLTAMTDPVIFPWGETSVVELNDHLKKVSDTIRETRAVLATRLHEVEDDYDDVAARLSVAYESSERDWLFYSDFFYKAIQTHLGGQLPLIRDPKTGVITVRAKQPNETLNYLRDVCAQRVRFHNYEGVRHLALRLADGAKEQVMIESELHIDTQVPLVSVNYWADNVTKKRACMLDWLQSVIVATYDDVTKYGPVAGVAWSVDVSEQEERIYLLNAGALLRAGQGDPKLAITTAIQRCQEKLPRPQAMGFFIYGNMPVVGEKAKGVLISTIRGEAANYKILVVGEDQKLSVAREGAEAKIDEAIIAVAKETMKEKEEKPEEG